MFARVNLETGDVTATVFVLPENLSLAGPEMLADLTFAGMPGYGLFPVIEGAAPAFNPLAERLGDVTAGAFDRAAGTVAGVRAVRPLTPEEIAARNPVPASVSSAQAKLILLEDGFLDRVEAIVAAMPRAVQIWYGNANVWERDNAYVRGIGLELDLTEADLDEMFRRAARRL